MKFAAGILVAYLACAKGQRGNNDDSSTETVSEEVDEFVFDADDFRPACHEDADCESGVCDTEGDNVNGDEDYYYCAEPDECDITASRRVDGICNNVNAGRRLRGSTGHLQLRRLEDSFSGGNVLFGSGPREISDSIGDSSGDIPNNFGGSTLMVFMGQFIDHDFTVIHMDFEVTTTIPGSGDVADFDFPHSEKIAGDGYAPYLLNDETAYLDLTQVYSGDLITESHLRSFSGGELLSQYFGDEEFLPYVTTVDTDDFAIEIAMSTLDYSFAAGDTRTNENVVLLSIHTLFMREHNRLAREFADEDPDLTDEELYQLAKKWNIAQYQNIVFNEFFPGWLGETLPDYDSYDDEETPDIDIAFSTSAFRFGHTVLANVVRRIDSDNVDSSFVLGEAFFRPQLVLEDGGVDSFLKGAFTQCHERFDTRVVDGIRNMLFEDIPGADSSPALDLLAFNIARGRDHDLPSYTSLREFFGLSVPETFDEVTDGDDCITEILEELYDDVADCDPIICSWAEPATHGNLGDLHYEQFLDQFSRLRNADRFYFENTAVGGPGFTADEIDTIEDTFMHDILHRNTFLNAREASDNYVLNAFQSAECCRTDGNDGNDVICVPQEDGSVEREQASHCDAVEMINAGTAYMAGSLAYDCDCVIKPTFALTVDSDPADGVDVIIEDVDGSNSAGRVSGMSLVSWAALMLPLSLVVADTLA